MKKKKLLPHGVLVVGHSSRCHAMIFRTKFLLFVSIFAPPNNPITAFGATSFPGYHSFPKWAIPGIPVKARRREYLKIYYLFLRKRSTGVNRSIWIIPGITENSIQMVSALVLTTSGWPLCRLPAISAGYNCSNTYNPPINFRVILLVTLGHVA